MLIALDHDGTYTVDPDLWLMFVATAKQRGHQVFLVTMRYPHEMVDVDMRLLKLVDKTIPTSRAIKRPFLEGMGHRVDVWIDDSPEFIVDTSLIMS